MAYGSFLIETDWGKLDLVLMGGNMLHKYLIQFFVDGRGCVPSLLFDLRLNYGGGNEDNSDLHQKVQGTHYHAQCPQPCSRPPTTHTSTRDSWKLTGKSSGGDLIPVEVFQILRADAVKVLHAICQQIWKSQQWPQDWKRSVFIPIPKKGNAKECSNYHTIALISHASKVM